MKNTEYLNRFGRENSQPESNDDETRIVPAIHGLLLQFDSDSHNVAGYDRPDFREIQPSDFMADLKKRGIITLSGLTRL